MVGVRNAPGIPLQHVINTWRRGAPSMGGWYTNLLAETIESSQNCDSLGISGII